MSEDGTAYERYVANDVKKLVPCGFVHPYQQKLIVYFFESELCPVIYGLDEPVPIAIYDGALEIRFEHIKRWIEKE